MIQDIHPHQLDIAFRQKTPDDGDYVLAFNGNNILWIQEGDDWDLPRYAAMLRLCPEVASALSYLFSVNETSFFYTRLEIPETSGLAYRDVMQFRGHRPNWLAFAGITASHLATWYEKNRFCGACGKPMNHKSDERALHCAACETVIYPGISPAVIVAVVDGDRIILTRYANRAHRRFALVAGFMEVGETLEDTVRREVMEEVGVRLRNIRYHKSQPWGFSRSVLVGFFADLDGSDAITVDTRELEEAVWVSRDDMPPSDSSFSLTAEMMEAFRLGVYPR